MAQMVKHLPTMRETQVRSLGWEDLLEREMATHFGTLAWKIPWTDPDAFAQHDFDGSCTLQCVSVACFPLGG